MKNHYSYYPGVLQFEISSMCNAQCPGCVRTYIVESNDPAVNTDITTVKTAVRPSIPKNVYLDLTVFKSIFTPRVRKELNTIEFCGTIDDPLMHPKFPEMIDFILDELPDVKITVHTNGSLRTPEYFERLSAKLKHHPGGVRFCFNIDGLSDTNALYRRNTNFEKIIDNARGFIRGGAKTVLWQYLIFPWNAHQVEQAQELAAAIGFHEFVVRNDRSLKNVDFKRVAVLATKTESWEHQKSKFDKIAQGSDIECIMQPRNMYFVNYEGNVWPCCFLNNVQYSKLGDHIQSDRRPTENYTPQWNNLYHYTMDEILSHRFYTEDLVDSWENTEHTRGCKSRILKCTSTCSKKQLSKTPFSVHKATEFPASS